MKGHIEQRGRDAWRIKFDLGRDPATGKRRIQNVTVKGGKRDAQRKMAELLAAVGKGEYVEPRKLTVAEHVEQRIGVWASKGDTSPKTTERYREILRNQIAPHIGNKALQALTITDVEMWHGTLLASGSKRKGGGGLSAQSVLHAHRLLSKALRDAKAHSLITRNVASAEGASPPRVRKVEVEIIDAAKLAGVLDALRGRAIYPKAITALFTGLRRSELLALRWGRIDFDRKTMAVREALEETRDGIRVKEVKTKAGRRDIDLPDTVCDALREHRRETLEWRLKIGAGRLADDDLVFPALSGEPQSPRQLSGDWREVRGAAGVPDVTWHALRHTHASQLIAAGLDVVLISKRLGHADPSITLRIYAHLFDAADRRASDAINALFPKNA